MAASRALQQLLQVLAAYYLVQEDIRIQMYRLVERGQSRRIKITIALIEVCACRVQPVIEQEFGDVVDDFEGKIR